MMETIPDEEKYKSVHENMPSVGVRQNVLGVSWDVVTDEFYFNVDVSDVRCTKRKMLSVTNSLYDPLGFVIPDVPKARLLYSKACQQKVSWDEPIAGSIQSKWKAWINGLPSLVNVRIKRWYDCTTPFQLYFFSDASSLGRGTVCYNRSIFKDSVTCQMIMAKSHKCGIKRTTIPRQELEAVLDAVTLSRVVKQELELDTCQCFFWTDSTIVIQSLHAQCKRFSLFPRNRLLRILKHTKVYDWKFVPSELNLADKASRGLTTKELLRNQTWFDGPVFLTSGPEDWPKPPILERPENVYAT